MVGLGQDGLGWQCSPAPPLHQATHTVCYQTTLFLVMEAGRGSHDYSPLHHLVSIYGEDLTFPTYLWKILPNYYKNDQAGYCHV